MTITQGGVAPPQPDTGARTVSQVLGEIVWLLTQSPVHKSLFLSDLEWAVMPAVLLEQFRIYYGEGKPAALVLWGSVSDEADARLSAGGAVRLRPDEWRSGEHLWLVDLVAPFGGVDEVIADAAVALFGGKPFKYQRLTPNGPEIVTHQGRPH